MSMSVSVSITVDKTETRELLINLTILHYFIKHLHRLHEKVFLMTYHHFLQCKAEATSK